MIAQMKGGFTVYNSQDIANRIKSAAKDRNSSVLELLSECKLGKNTIYKISKGTDILTLNFAKIADYLDCSIDYLVGRTDNPQSHKESAVTVKDVSKNSGAIGLGNTVTNNATSTRNQGTALINIFEELDPINQAKLLVYADELAKKQAT